MTPPERFSREIAGRHDELPRLADLLHELRAGGRLSEPIHHILCIVVDEIGNNLLTHAFGERTDHRISLLVERFADRVELELADDGAAFDPIGLDVAPPSVGGDALPLGGFGLYLVRSLVDEMSYCRIDGLNRLRVVCYGAPRHRLAIAADTRFASARGGERRQTEPPELPIVGGGPRIEFDRRRGERRLRHLGGHVPLFRDVDLLELDRILADCPVLELAEQRILIRKGEKNEHLYILLAGEMFVQLDFNDPAPIRIAPGESVGEVSLIDGEPASAYVIARPGARLIVIADEVFWQRIIPLPGVARNLMRSQTRRLRANNEAILAHFKHELHRQQMESDLRIAADIQRGMLPRNFPLFPERTEIDLHATMSPAREVGGDFYDAFLNERGQLVFAVGDVSGKGVAAALFMVRSMTLLRAETRHAERPLEMLERINHLLCAENPQSMFVTLCLGVLDIESGRVRLGNAGHLPPALGADGQWRRLPPSCSSLLGIWDEAQFAEDELTLAAGETLLLYSDGVTEARPPGRLEQFGEARLAACLDGCDGRADATVARVLAAVSGYAAGSEPFDDITILALRYRGRG